MLFRSLDVMASLSMFYELIEWGAALFFGGDLGMAYLGTQGDEWDAQKDMVLATLGGFLLAILSFILSIVFFILKLIFWDRFNAGTAPIVIGLFFFTAVQLFFIGLLGEYIASINTRVMRRPLVVEKERINFE